MCKNHIELGRWGEDEACKYLERIGYSIIKRNFRCRLGEIDIIAFKDNTLTFIEVKTRRTKQYGLPCEAVNFHKQKRIRNSACFFLKTIESEDIREYQFDVIEIGISYSTVQINHIKQAF